MRFIAQHKDKQLGEDGWLTWQAADQEREWRILFDRYHPKTGYVLSWRRHGQTIWHDLGSHEESKYAQLAATAAQKEFAQRNKRRVSA